MSSLLTNTSAMSALRSLTATQKALTDTADQVSTGLRVSEPSDNAAYWSISTTMKARTAGLGAAQDSLNLTRAIADVSYAAVNSVIGQVQQIQKDVVSSEEPGVDKTAVQSDIAARQDSIRSTIQSASFNGVNWLKMADPYSVNETISDNQTISLSKLAYDRARVGTTWSTTDALHDDVSVTDPYGLTSTYSYDQSAESWDVTKTAHGPITTNLQRPAPSFTESINSSLIDGVSMPFGAGDTGTYMEGVAIGTFALLADVTTSISSTSRVSYSDQSTRWSQTSNYLGSVGTAKIWSDENNPGQTFLAKVLPASPLTSLLSLDVTDTASTASLNEGVVRLALSATMNVAGQIGSLLSRIGIQHDFNSALSDALTAGYGSLVDADMNVASTRLQALQTQQQLGIQSLSIANDNSKQILKLFA